MRTPMHHRVHTLLQSFGDFLRRELRPSAVILSLLGSAILALGLCHIHAYSDVTEGGILGLTLLLDHHFHISPALSGLILNVLFYLMGWKFLGKPFLLYSFISSVNFSLVYDFFEQFDTFFPTVVQSPLLSSLVGAVFVGVGCGLCVLVGGAPTGDDAFAMVASRLTGKNIQWMYLISDLSVLGLSLTYIPLHRISYSLLTVLLSGQIVGWIQKIPLPNAPSLRKPQTAE